MGKEQDQISAETELCIPGSNAKMYIPIEDIPFETYWKENLGQVLQIPISTNEVVLTNLKALLKDVWDHAINAKVIPDVKEVSEHTKLKIVETEPGRQMVFVKSGSHRYFIDPLTAEGSDVLATFQVLVTDNVEKVVDWDSGIRRATVCVDARRVYGI